MYGKLRHLAVKLQPEVEKIAREMLEAILDPSDGREAQYTAMATLYTVVAALEQAAPAGMAIAKQLCCEFDELAEADDFPEEGGENNE